MPLYSTTICSTYCDYPRYYAKEMSDWMRKQVKTKPEVAQKLIPNYELGCKRITPSDVYLKVLPTQFYVLYSVYYHGHNGWPNGCAI